MTENWVGMSKVYFVLIFIFNEFFIYISGCHYMLHHHRFFIYNGKRKLKYTDCLCKNVFIFTFDIRSQVLFCTEIFVVENMKKQYS